MVFRSKIIFTFLVAGLFTAGIVAEDRVTLETLLQETTSVERLAVMPVSAYTTRQFSSYDRNSTDPEISSEEKWFANYDRNQYIRIEENQG
ncbi:MAG: hypothetical protein KAH38_07525, partial [Candidatus Hydrogenedentes bacterium]|nr:hypothetical protein [Candidatus Hydrogenedentota bacterium]